MRVSAIPPSGHSATNASGPAWRQRPKPKTHVPGPIAATSASQRQHGSGRVGLGMPMTIVQIRSLAPIRKLDAKADEFRRDLFGGRIASEPIEVKGRSMRQRPSRFSGKTANAQHDAELDSVGKRGRVGDGQRDLIVPREKDAKRHSHAQDVARWPDPIRLSMLGRKRLRLRRLEERHLE